MEVIFFFYLINKDIYSFLNLLGQEASQAIRRVMDRKREGEPGDWMFYRTHE